MNSAADFNVNYRADESAERDYWAKIILHWLQGDSDRSAQPIGIDSEKSPRLTLLADIFGLDDYEQKVVATLWVCAYSPEIKNALLAHDAVAMHLSPLLMSRIFDEAPVYRLSSESPLIVWEMVREQELVDGSVALTIDPQIVAWLEGNHELDRSLVSRVSLLAPVFELASWNLAELKQSLVERLGNNESCRVFLRTDDEYLAMAFFAALARELEIPTTRYELRDLPADFYYRFSIRVQRQSFLDKCVPMFAKESQASSEPANVAAFPLQFIWGKPSVDTKPVKEIDKPGGSDVIITLPELTNEDRRQIWLHCLPEITKWPGEQFEDLVWRSHLSATDIRRACSIKPTHIQQVTDFLRNTREDDLAGLAQKINSQFAWDDLVVPDDVADRLEEIIFEARERNRLWSESEARRLFPYGRGLVALFSGPPGSGKTMAAQVIANELGLDLLRVDLSAVVSKWVGETTQNLQKILSAKSSRRAVLFFDEADTLYGKRVNDIKDANDRYVNLDSGHLMVALENFDGIVIMATNLKANIDAAFIRRIRHMVEFVKPAAEARKKIWLSIVSALFHSGEAENLMSHIDHLAEIEATGAQIKSAALSSVFAVRRTQTAVSARLLGEMLCRELAKDGRGLSERELSRRLGEP